MPDVGLRQIFHFGQKIHAAPSLSAFTGVVKAEAVYSEFDDGRFRPSVCATDSFKG